MAKKELPSPEYLRKLVRYDPETGELFWRKRDASEYAHCKDPRHDANAFNRKWAGKLIGYSNGKGYLTINLRGQPMAAHRVAWAVHYGHWPKDHIDHINGKRDDNRIENLRDVTCAENLRNRAYRPRGVSGVVGVYPTRNGKWQARLYLKDRAPCFGNYDTISEAAEAIRIARIALGFTDRF